MDGERAGGAEAACAAAQTVQSRMLRWLVAATMIAALLAGHVLSLHDSDGDYASLGPSLTVTGAASFPVVIAALQDKPVIATALDHLAGSAVDQLPVMAGPPADQDVNLLVAVACAISLALAGAAFGVVLVAVLRRVLMLTSSYPIGPPPNRLTGPSGRRPDQLALGVLRV